MVILYRITHIESVSICQGGFLFRGSGFRGSGFRGSAPPPAKKRPVKSQKKLPKLLVLLLNVGAVFNRDLFGLAYLYVEVS